MILNLCGITFNPAVVLGPEHDFLFKSASTYCVIRLYLGPVPPYLFSNQKDFFTLKKSSIYICGGYNPVDEMKDCFKLDLAKPTEGWIQIAPMLSGRYNFALVTANGLIYAVGGQDLNSEVNTIEVSYLMYKF